MTSPEISSNYTVYPALGVLALKKTVPELQGTYTCELSTDSDISDTITVSIQEGMTKCWYGWVVYPRVVGGFVHGRDSRTPMQMRVALLIGNYLCTGVMALAIIVLDILFKCLMPQMCVNVMSESMLGVRIL